MVLTDLEIPRWGQPETALLPKSLRRAFAADVLPNWLLRELDLPVGATALALDSTVWRDLDAVPIRVGRFLINLVTGRVTIIRNVRVMDGEWPSGLTFNEVPWPPRILHALRRTGLVAPDRLERLTYGDLLAVPGLGVKSVLEFAVIADAISTINAGAPDRVLDAVIRTDLEAASEEDWSERIRVDDPRFSDVSPPYSGSLADLFEETLNNLEGQRAREVVRALPRIRARAVEIASDPLDIGLLRLARSVAVSERDVDITATRLGWRGGRLRTLQEVGEQFSITRERVRQIVKRVLSRIGRAYLPQLMIAVETLTDAAPMTVPDASNLLVERGLSTVPIDPSVIRRAADLLGYEVTFHVDSVRDVDYVLAEGPNEARATLIAAKRQVCRVGVSNIEEVQADLRATGKDYAAERISRVLSSSPNVVFLGDDWFWISDIPPSRNRLRNVTQRMLSVVPRLDIATARQGVRRRYRFRQIDVVPPIGVLTAFYAAHPEFLINDDRTVESVVPLDYRDVLGDVERTFVEVLRDCPTGVMDRAELEEAVTGRGVNGSTFSVFTTYSPILDHPAIDVWCLRGYGIDPAQIEALRAISATRSRQRRTLDYLWDSDGCLQLAVDVGNANYPVIGIPAVIARYVAGRKFEALTQEGSPTGTVVIDDNGASWGYGPFLRRRGAEIGDALVLRFNSVTATVTLSLTDASAP